MSVEVSLNHVPVINFAMQQNHVAVIREITIKNTGDEELENISVEIGFDPSFADPITLHVERIGAGSKVQLNDIPVHISTTYLSNLTERMSGTIRVEVKSGEKTEAKQTSEISLLAFDQWSGLSVLPAMLASFVTPNHPEIMPIIKRASEILEKWTGSPSLDEYQTRDPNRVKLQMAAIYEAIAEKQIAYCTVPASFEDYGQRIRLYSEIVQSKLATCLDMALLYAGCLEAVGLHPLIVVVKGHAFAGAWLMEETFPDSVNDDVSLLTKRTAEGINEILLVETTCMNAGSRVTFDGAVENANEKLKDIEAFQLFIDVKRARNARIRPLPLRVVRDGAYVVEEERVTERHADAPSAMSETHEIEETGHVAVGKQTIWERKLLDLSLRNNLLNTRVTKNTLQLISAKVNELEDALAAGAEFQILAKPQDWDNELMSSGIYKALNASDPIMDLVKSELSQKRLYSYLNEETLQKSLTYLYRSSRLSLEENGANTLYLAIGLLRWLETPSSTRPRFAPILLVPIEIIRKSAAKGYVIRSRDEDTSLNITLLEMLRQDFGITVSGLDPLPTDDSGVDVAKVFSIIRHAIMSETGWDVEEQAVIGNFSFNKFIMWNDIHNNADKLSRSKIVSSLISGKTEFEEEEEKEETDLDETYPAGTVALPIAADSSQFEAICSAVDEKSFILHGPPGTGKSQTITNIIANALYNGKKVLFVAEKMAALQVVQRRLDAIGLAPFCLELHSNKTKKSYILEQLKRTMDVVKRKSSEEFRIKAEQINELRRDLNGYVNTLHKTYGAGLSLYDCFAGYAGTPYAGETVKIREEVLAGLTPTSRANAEVAVAEYQAISRLCGSPAKHPLNGIGLTEFSASVKTKAAADLAELVAEVERYQQSLREVMKLLKIEIEDLQPSQQLALSDILSILLDAETIPTGLLKTGGNNEIFTAIEKAVATGKSRDAARKALTEVFSESILTWDAEAWENKWRESFSKWLLPRALDQGKVKSQLKAFNRSGKTLSAEVISDVFEQLKTYHTLQAEIDAYDKEIAPAIGTIWNKDHADWIKIENAAHAAQELNRQIVVLTQDVEKAAELKEVICRNLDCGLDAFRELNGKKLQTALDNERAVAEKTAELKGLLDADCLTEKTLAELRDTAERWARNIDLLHDRVAYNRQRGNVETLGFRELVDEVENGGVAVEDITSCFSKSLYRDYAEYILSKEPQMNSFHGLLFDDKIERFRQFSAEFERLTREELYARLASGLPALNKEAAQSSEVGILQRNIRNGGRGTSIRRLFDQIPELLTRMCPCMLMSPISVAQYIDANRSPFDLVIFDEASQMPTSEAVGAIARGHNVIVVGDPKQMPPTNFFSTNTFDEDNAEKEDMENILEDCLALTMPSKYLRWHYRSKHESLIAFSNMKYYDNKLLTFPSPDDLTTKVGWQHVEGIYDRGKSRQNRAEAEAVIEEIKRRLSDPELAKRSIGVVTFNTNQQSLIEDLLNDLFSKHPELENVAMGLEDPIFVKNLENVQGDERDVILFSIGYGPDKEGKIALNFGPLNRDGGCRRLNVAVSRARYEMKVFSTLKSEQIDLNRSSADGVADLKAFLEYAEKGRDYLAYNVATESKDADGLVDSIAKELSARGYAVRTNIGCSGYKIDLGVVDSKNPDKYLMGILCDGYHFHSSRTANDRLVSQSSVLKMLGWRLHRVWSMDWWENPGKTIDSIVSAIEEAKMPAPPKPIVKPEPTPLKSSPATPIEKKEEAVADADADDHVEPYTESKLKEENLSPDDFASGLFNLKILDKIAKVIESEAPVSKSLLCKRVVNSFGITRMGPRITAHIDRLLRQANHRTSGSADAIFYWTQDQNPENYDKYRPDSGRDALDIAPEEIAVAICRILEEQVSIPTENLKKEVAQRMGFARLSENVNHSVSRGIDYALSKNRIVIQDDRVKLP